MNEKRFNQIVRDIKSIKIQGARNIAKAALYAHSLIPTEKSKKILENARLTEPMLVNCLNNFKKLGYKKTMAHFQESQDAINKLVLKIIKNNSAIITHCHSTNVVQALIYANKHGKKFQVYSSETRPLFQGRKTARELSKAGIKVITFIDSAEDSVFEKAGKKIIFLGADAILKSGIINKVGSAAISELAFFHKIPVYIIADSWKYSSHYVKLEQRDFHEVWKRVPKHIKILNPAFELVKKRYIKSVVSELGILPFQRFLKKAHNIYSSF